MSPRAERRLLRQINAAIEARRAIGVAHIKSGAIKLAGECQQQVAALEVERARCIARLNQARRSSPLNPLGWLLRVAA